MDKIDKIIPQDRNIDVVNNFKLLKTNFEENVSVLEGTIAVDNINFIVFLIHLNFKVKNDIKEVENVHHFNNRVWGN